MILLLESRYMPLDLPGWCLVEESSRVEYHLAHSQSHTVILKYSVLVVLL